ncbi:MAG: hypothetical protein HC873_05045 [Leptolyngbyaceae cyanobacterium SL_1_1]|nr:hypothetical protein [Leptolyngbyaceae cyanobacterium SL_1_1]
MSLPPLAARSRRPVRKKARSQTKPRWRSGRYSLRFRGFTGLGAANAEHDGLN